MDNQDIIDARNRLGAGRIIAKNLQPYFSRGLDSIETVEKPGTGRITVDKYWRLYYDPEYCLSLTAKELASEWLHNVNHLFRGHPERFENIEGLEKSRIDFNVSADAIINSELRKEGVIMPNPQNKPYIENGEELGWKPGMTVEQLYWLSIRAKRSQMDSKRTETDEATTPPKSEENPSDGNTEPTEGDSGEENESQIKSSENKEQNGDSEEENKDRSEGDTDSQEENGLNNEESTSDDLSSNGENESSDMEDAKGAESDNNSQEKSDETPSNGEPDSSDNDNKSSDEESSSENSQENGMNNENENGDSVSSIIPTQENQGDDSTSLEGGNVTENSNNDSSSGSNSEQSGDPNIPNHNKSTGDTDESNKSGGSEIDDESDNSTSKSTPSQSYTEREFSDYGDETVDEHGLWSDEHDCGSGAGGEPREWEDEPDEKAMDRTNAEILKNDIAKDMINHERSNPGSIPGNLIRDAKRVLEPDYDWIQEFMNILRKEAGSALGRLDHTYSRMSKKQSSQNPIILPGWEAPDPFEVAVVIDTSGSMDEASDISLALGMLNDLLKAFGRDSELNGLHLVSCDAGATATFVKDLKEAQLVGGGGTDMRKGIRLASKLRPMVDVIITITDGGTSWMKQIPESNRKAKYITVLVGDKIEKGIPDWMHVIKVRVPASRSHFKPYNS